MFGKIKCLSKRVIEISKQVLLFKSVSQAERALEILKNYGYSGYIKRSAPGAAGKSCGFSVNVESSDLATLKEILRKNGLQL